MLVTILAFGIVANFDGLLERAVRPLAAIDAFARQRGVRDYMPIFLTMSNQPLDKVKAQLGPAAFEAAWAKGQCLTLEQAIALVTEDESQDALPPNARYEPNAK